MTAEEIFKEALRSLAAEGNEKAQFALDVAAKSTETGREVRPNVLTALKNAHSVLSYAIRLNADEWTQKVDREIQSAQQLIVDAIGYMTR